MFGNFELCIETVLAMNKSWYELIKNHYLIFRKITRNRIRQNIYTKVCQYYTYGTKKCSIISAYVFLAHKTQDSSKHQSKKKVQKRKCCKTKIEYKMVLAECYYVIYMLSGWLSGSLASSKSTIHTCRINLTTTKQERSWAHNFIGKYLYERFIIYIYM